MMTEKSGCHCGGINGNEYVTARRLARWLMKKFSVDPQDDGIAVRMHPDKVVNNEDAVLLWVMDTLPWMTEVNRDQVAEELSKDFYNFVMSKFADISPDMEVECDEY